MLKLSRVMVAILNFDQQTIHKFSTDADILKRTYLCQVSDTGSSEPLVFF
jgi:hypothetical protein